MPALTLDQAEKIIAAARRERMRLKEVPLAYAVLDSGGHVVAMAREDGAGFLRAQIAANKAWTCFAVGMPLRSWRDHTEGHQQFFAAVNGAGGGRVMYAIGGVVIRDAKGNTLGALGISGAKGEVDEAICV
ncbi:MAG: GlcG/HbpS family heme-binding protein, partial [Rhodospirillales bacterium]